MVIKKGKLYFTGKWNLVFSFNPEILAKLFNLIFYLILTPTLILTPQLSPTLTVNPT